MNKHEFSVNAECLSETESITRHGKQECKGGRLQWLPFWLSQFGGDGCGRRAVP